MKQDEITKYSYNRGSVKAFKLIKQVLKSNVPHNVLIKSIDGMIDTLEKNCKEFEDKYNV